jgi:hypothetical protein
MGQRRILVIGSQCRALGRLSFLPQAAQDLYEVMTDSNLGGCVSALGGRAGLLIDPSVKDAKDAIKTAYRSAAQDEATLFIAYIGHGERAGEDFYLLPDDAENPPDADTAVHLTNLIKEAHKKASGRPDGLGVLVDACYAGVAAFGAAEAWVGGLEGTLRFEVLTAAADRPAADGCFSKTLVALLRNGISEEPSEHLHCLHLRPLIKAHCPKQVPQHPSYNPDQTLWLAKNTGRVVEPWAQTALADEILRLTLGYQATPSLSDVVAHSGAHRCVAVVGEAGTGKSALAAALSWPRVTEGMVPPGFVHGVALLTEATTPHELARTLGEQLGRAAPGFREAQQAFARETPYAEQQRLGTIEKQLIGPLKRLAPASEVRLVVDALDRLPTGAKGSVMEALDELSECVFVRLVVTARPDTALPAQAEIHPLTPAPEEKVRQYLERRAAPPARSDEVVQAACGNWLVARVLADILCEQPDAPISAGQLALRDAYEEMLVRSGVAADKDAWPVLTVLAAAGAGPALPLLLLCAACEALGRPTTPARVRDQLVRLRGLVVRTAAGTEGEHTGLFHQTFVEHVSEHVEVAVRDAHRALLTSIEALAPAAARPVNLNDPVQRYAFEREAEHWWALDEAEKALDALQTRTSPGPRDNLRRWQLWAPRVHATFAPDHRDTLRTRHNLAFWTGECGDAREALRLAETLLPDRTRVLGPDHPDTLTTRHYLADWTGECGDAREALRLAEALLADRTRVLGPDHPETLRTRSNLAFWTGQCGDAREALRLTDAVLPDLIRVLGADHPDTLRARSNLAAWTGECGDARDALRLYKALLADQTRVLRADHPDTVSTRRWIGHLSGTD